MVQNLKSANKKYHHNSVTGTYFKHQHNSQLKEQIIKFHTPNQN